MSNSRFRLISYTTLFASIVFGIAGQLLMKQAMSNPNQELFSWLFIKQLLIGLIIYSIGVVNWVFALRFLKLSIAYPLTSLNYVGIVLGSYYFFNEKITIVGIFGIFLVFVGILLVVLPVTNYKRL